jgi:hypothetical protein
MLAGIGAAGCHHPVRPVKSPVEATEGTLKKFSVLVGKATVHQGFFDLYQKGDELYMAVPKARLGEEFLLHSRIAQGVGVEPLGSGQLLGRREVAVVSLQRHGDRLFLVQRQTRVIAKKGTSLSQAVAQSFSRSVLQSAVIESERPDGAAIINIKTWLLGDLSPVGGAVGSLSSGSTSGKPLVPSKERSYVESVKAFPENLNLRASLTFTPGEQLSLPTVADQRFISLTVHYTFARLPAEPMAPRLEDDRIGFLVLPRQDVSSTAPEFMVRYVNRWRLEPAEQVGSHVRPRRPIVFYIDPSVPAEFRQAVKEGVEAWQPAFAAAGFTDAIRAEPLPKGVDPEDLRYSCIRWDVGQVDFRGGTSLVNDPRSGEILGASIRLSQNMVGSYLWKDLLYAGASAAAIPRAPLHDGEADGLNDSELFAGMAVQNALLRASLVLSGAISPSDPTPLRMLLQGIKKTAMHEVGHALGLAHNFKASSTVPNEKLGDMEWVRQYGLTGSVMDYPAINLPKGQAPSEWFYFSPVLGPSDLYSITWGYTPDEERARRLAREAAQHGHVLGLYDSPHRPSHLDPSDLTFDLGSDPLAWAAERCAMIEELLRKLPGGMLVDNAQYGELTEAFLALFGSYEHASAVALRYLGGQYSSRDHVGDPDGKPPFTPVQKARQREALGFLLGGVLGERAFSFPPELLQRLGPTQPASYSPNRALRDVRLFELLQSAQTGILMQMLQPETLARLRNAELKFGPMETLTTPELFEQLTQSLWSELISAAPRNVGMLRRDLQRRYLERLGVLLLSRGDRDSAMATDLRALSRAQLTELKRRLSVPERLIAGLDAYTRAHVADSLAHITKLLDAQIVVD